MDYSYKLWSNGKTSQNRFLKPSLGCNRPSDAVGLAFQLEISLSVVQELFRFLCGHQKQLSYRP